MVEVAGKRRKRSGLTRRMVRSTLRVGMLATAVLVGRKTAGGARARDGQGTGGGGGPEAPGGLGAAALSGARPSAARGPPCSPAIRAVAKGVECSWDPQGGTPQ